jgi:hypothetical protein
MGYFVMVGSTTFLSQCDSVTAFQLSHIFHEQGIPASNVFIWVPRQQNVTIENPRSFPGGSVLGPPAAYVEAGSICYDSANVVKMAMIIGMFFQNKNLDAITFIFLNHGTEESLLVCDTPLDIGGFRAMVDILAINSDGRPRNILAILDCCHSRRFAEKVLSGPVSDGLWILSAGERPAMSTLIVTSANESLVNKCSDGSGVCYSVFGSMFSREVMQGLAYSEENVELRGVPACLHRRIPDPVKRGFTCACHTTSGQNLTMRHFFAACPKNFPEVILPRFPTDHLCFDDYALAFPHDKPAIFDPGLYRFVEIREVATGEGFEVARYGVVDSRVSAQDALWEHILQNRGQEHSNRRKRRHVGLDKLFSAALGELNAVLEINRTVAYEEVWDEIMSVLLNVNGFVGVDRCYMPAMMREWRKHELDEWRKAFEDAHSRCLREATQ